MILVSISLVTPQAAMEFGPRYATLLSVPLYAGLLVGAIVLGGLADNIGRRLVWQASIFGVSIMTMVAAASPNWASLNVFIALIGVFGGGNRTSSLGESQTPTASPPLSRADVEVPIHSCN